MKIERSSGLLMHITSLPGRYGIGTLGPEAYEFADFLVASAQRFWQILPFNPVVPHLGYSPYTATSTYAGNPYFISLEKVKSKDWVPDDMIPDDGFDAEENHVNFDKAIRFKMDLLQRVFDLFEKTPPAGEMNEFHKFCDVHTEWLNDFALYEALAEHYGTYDWLTWDKDIAFRKESAIKEWSERLKPIISFQKFLQYIFFQQWGELKAYCNSKGVKIIGDIPIYISFESSDAWANPGIFQLDENTGKPNNVAGVPPDYFSSTGQRWGNPLYIWFDENEKLYRPTLEWWIKRIKHLETTVNILRIDHFRAFESYWSINSEEQTAMNGHWVKGPGEEFFKELEKALGDLPLIAEDLGIITPEVEKLRDNLNLPGMKILQFAFDRDPRNSYIPHNLRNSNCVVYTGTHDNNTTNGWYYGGDVDPDQKEFIKHYMNIPDDTDFHWKFVKLALSTVADLVIIPVQDILGFDKNYRMNTPGTAFGNWSWKIVPGRLYAKHINRMRELNYTYNRIV